MPVLTNAKSSVSPWPLSHVADPGARTMVAFHLAGHSVAASCSGVIFQSARMIHGSVSIVTKAPSE
eukprot:8067300-Pyramimonas_sp.AAC.1